MTRHMDGTRHMRGPGGTVAARLGIYPGMPEPALTGIRAPERSTESLLLIIRKSALSKNPADVLSAANELGQRVGRLREYEALGYVLRFCSDGAARSMALEKLSARILEARGQEGMSANMAEVPVLESVLLASSDPAVMHEAARLLSTQARNVTSTPTLVLIAQLAEKASAGVSALLRLSGNSEALAAVQAHAKCEAIRRMARTMGGMEPDGGRLSPEAPS